MESRDLILEEARKFLTFTNPNNFDDYFAKVLPDSSKFNYIYVCKEPIELNINDKKKNNYKKRNNSTGNKNNNNEYVNAMDFDDEEEKKNDEEIDNLNKYLSKKRDREIFNSNNKNNNNLNTINKINNSSLNNNKKKNSNNEEEEEIKTEVLECFNCHWKFPLDMTLKRRQLHINKCYDGQGEIDKNNYNRHSCNKLNEENTINMDKCPLCNRYFHTKNPKIKVTHITECLALISANDRIIKHNYSRSVVKDDNNNNNNNNNIN